MESKSVKEKILGLLKRQKSEETPVSEFIKHRSATGIAVTVIIPVYNAEQYLEQCLESVLQQSLTPTEIICIDDASTDSSGSILAKHSNLDKRIKVITNKSNLGTSVSRNEAINMATGDFLQFLDADDLLPPDALAMLHAKAMDDQVDLVKGVPALFKNDAPDTYEMVSAMETKSRITPLKQQELWIPWWHQSYLFSRHMVLDKGVRFPELRKGEDPVFLAAVLVAARSMSTIADVTYLYRERTDPKRLSLEDFADYLEHASLTKAILSDYSPECWDRGYGPFLLKDIKEHFKNSYFSVDQKIFLLTEVEKTWGYEMNWDEF